MLTVTLRILSEKLFEQHKKAMEHLDYTNHATAQVLLHMAQACKDTADVLEAGPEAYKKQKPQKVIATFDDGSEITL